MFAKRYPVSVILPGTVRKAECGWTKSEEEAEERKKKKRLSPAYTQFHLLLNFVRASAGDTDVGSGESLSPCP